MRLRLGNDKKMQVFHPFIPDSVPGPRQYMIPFPGPDHRRYSIGLKCRNPGKYVEKLLRTLMIMQRLASARRDALFYDAESICLDQMPAVAFAAPDIMPGCLFTYLHITSPLSVSSTRIPSSAPSSSASFTPSLFHAADPPPQSKLSQCPTQFETSTVIE